MVGQEPIADMNTEILKMPLGFIRVVQLPMIILAFSTLASYSVTVEFEAPNAEARTLQWGYPFALTDTKLEDTPLTIPVRIGVLPMSFFLLIPDMLKTFYFYPQPIGSTNRSTPTILASATHCCFISRTARRHISTFSLASRACCLLIEREWNDEFCEQLFLAFTLLFVTFTSLVLALLAVYVFAWTNYENQTIYAKVDFVITVYLTFCWLIGVIILWFARKSACALQFFNSIVCKTLIEHQSAQAHFCLL